MCKVTRGFVAYPSQPPLRRETVTEAVNLINTTGVCQLTRWEDLRVSGRLVVDEVLDAIARSDFSMFELTAPNENVLFELGYAIGIGKPVWVFRDPSDARAERHWGSIRTLTTLGYAPYTNSDQVREAFLKDRAWLVDDDSSTTFSESIAPYLNIGSVNSAFYLLSPHNTDASRGLTRQLNDAIRGTALKVIADDPSETTTRPLAWYGEQLGRAGIAMIHFTSPDRTGAEIHNARCALISGLAHGFGIPLLMVAEADYLVPLDYRDLLYVYSTKKELIDHTASWLYPAIESVPGMQRDIDRRQSPQIISQLLGELGEISLGDYVAENEATELPDYFVDTDYFKQVMNSRVAIFVGRKGVGKSASMIEAARRLREDKRNLVITIRPSEYELEGLTRLLRLFGTPDTRTFLVETVWKYLLITELAIAAGTMVSERPAPPTHGSAEFELLEYVNANRSRLFADFGIRLEDTVRALSDVEALETMRAERETITEALHAREIAYVRDLLKSVLVDRERIAILVDNLDKAWRRSSDIDELSFLLLGLVGSARKLVDDLERRKHGKPGLRVSLAIFMRSDIFGSVARVAREPDKLPVVRMRWADESALLSVVERRFLASNLRASSGTELWERFFCPTINGHPTRSYIASRVLPRPRDLVYFCSAALASAVRSRRGRVEPEDIEVAEDAYSTFAFEAVLVENGISVHQLEDVLFEFAGGPAVVDHDDVMNTISRAGIPDDLQANVVDHLKSLSFLGVETGAGEYVFFEQGVDQKKVEALAHALSRRRGSTQRYRIHPAFQPFLELQGADDP